MISGMFDSCARWSGPDGGLAALRSAAVARAMVRLFDMAFRAELEARCAAFGRQQPDPSWAGLGRAAVAIALLADDDGSGRPAFLLTLRAAGLRSHGGQWALPGGRLDAGETAPEAALRELDEELGLTLGADQVIGLLDDYPTRSGYLVTPVVVWAGENATPVPNPQEVASVHRIPVSDIARAEAFDFTTIAESERPVVRARIAGTLIHAPTAALIYQFREVLAGRTTRVDGLEQPVFAWK
jgi:8-oxo-dGTP pyrophosphatase MutT (NUDIX family)